MRHDMSDDDSWIWKRMKTVVKNRIQFLFLKIGATSYLGITFTFKIFSVCAWWTKHPELIYLQEDFGNKLRAIFHYLRVGKNFTQVTKNWNPELIPQDGTTAHEE
jgi:hypothetical protein